jgi:hypothetical protein
VVEPSRRKAPALGCCWADHGPACWEKERNKWAAGLRAVKKSSLEWRLDTLENREKKSGGARPASGPHGRKRKPAGWAMH